MFSGVGAQVTSRNEVTHSLGLASDKLPRGIQHPHQAVVVRFILAAGVTSRLLSDNTVMSGAHKDVSGDVVRRGSKSVDLLSERRDKVKRGGKWTSVRLKTSFTAAN